MDISGQFLGIYIPIYKNCIISTLKQMPGSFTFHIKIGCIGPIDMPHDLREVAGRGFDQQMIMIVHETIGVYEGIVSLSCRFEVGKKLFSVTLTLKNDSLFISP